jgi:cytochrome b
MSTTLNQPSLSVATPIKSPVSTRRVSDVATRTFHWLFAFSFLGAYLTADFERLRGVHVALGYTMLGLLGFRIVWGVVGPKHVRFKLLFGKLSGGRTWLNDVRKADSIQAMPWRQGQNLLMAIAVLSLLVLVLPLVGSGYLVNNDLGGKFIENAHEFFGELYLWTVISHIALIALMSVLRLRNMASPMLTGRVPGPGPDLVKTDQRVWAAILMLGCAAWWVWSLFR